MSESVADQAGGNERLSSLSRDAQAHWFAAYTLANHEKQVAEQLETRSIEQFLPTYESVRHWKDRRMRLQLPLFPGYVFVRIAPKARVEVLRLRSVVRFIGFNGCLAVLPDEEIEALRRGIREHLRAEPHPYLTAGRRVRIRSGPLRGREGILVSRKGNFRVVLSIELIRRSIAVEMDAADLQLPVS